MNRFINILLLLCAALTGGHAQEVIPPTEGQPDFDWVIATLGGTNYKSLPLAFEAVNGDNAAIQLKNGTAVDKAIEVKYTTLLDINGLPLVLTTDAKFTIFEDKTLTIKDGKASSVRHSGSLKMDGKGNLMAGADVNLAGISVLDATATNLYRVLVTLPGTGAVSDPAYGNTPVARFAQNGSTLCCWLPQSQVARTIKFGYTSGGTSTDYETEPVIVTTHAATALTAKTSQGGATDNNVAKIGDTHYTSLTDALAAVRDGQTVELTANASLAGIAKPTGKVTLSLNGKTLSSSGTAGLEPETGGRLILENGTGSGRVTGTLSVNERCHIRGDVSLTAAILKDSKQVYRVRVALPGDATTATRITYSYGDDKDMTLNVLTEKESTIDKPVAYLWLSAHTATPFNLVLTDTGGNQRSLTRHDVAIQPHHDNRIILTLGDAEAILYADPNDPTKGTPYETFHDALEDAGKIDGSLIVLQRDVQFSGKDPHPHTISAGKHVELRLEGHLMTATNCTLDASAAKACLLISDPTGRGRIEGNFRILGNVHIGKEIAAGSIGNVSKGDGNEALLYRVLALVKTDGNTALTDGIVSCQWDNEAAQECYLRANTACVWAPISAQPATLRVTVNGQTYTANAVQVTASHGNTVTVKRPDIVASVDGIGFTSLSDAWAAALGTTRGLTTGTIKLLESVVLDAPLAVTAGKRLVLDLGSHTLTAQDKAALLTESDGTLLVTSDTELGALAGNVEVTDHVTVSAKAAVTGLMRLAGATVYRARLLLPTGTNAATYTYGDDQAGTLRLIDETAGTQTVGYAWLRVANGARDLVATVTDPVPGQVKTLTNVTVQATHNNQFDMEAGDDVASIDGTYYPTLKSAIEALNAAAGGTVTLARPVTLQDKLQVNKPVTLDLRGYNLAATPGAHISVADNASLRIVDNAANTAKGIVSGDLLLDGNLAVSREVRLTATTVRDGRVVYRLRVDGLPAAATEVSYNYPTSGDHGKLTCLGGTAYLWTEATDREEDLRLTADNVPHTVLIRPTAPGHGTALKACLFREVKTNETWADASNEDTDVEVAPGAILTLQAGCGLKTIRRVTLGEGAQVVATDNILATEGIRYRKTFQKANTWQTLSLPFEPRKVTTEEDGMTIDLMPNLASGTGGHYWLRSLKQGDGLVHVDEARVVANRAYIIAVPEALTTDGGGKGITFTSPGDQYLNRKALAATLPSGKRMDLMATGALRDVELILPFYRLNTDGDRFVRETPAAGSPGKLAPFSCYLLVEPELVATQSSFRLAGLATANESVTAPGDRNGLRITTERGTLIVEAIRATPLTVYDTAGRVVLHRSVSEGTTRLTLQTGNYIVNQTIIHIP